MNSSSDLRDRLVDAELYTSGQGDKFHPLSDRLRELFEQYEQDGQDSLTSYEPRADEQDESELEAQEQLLTAILDELDRYEVAPDWDPYHAYHTGRLRTMLAASEEEID